MKLKYKKIILLTTMSTMGIGLLTLSISKDQPKAQESLKLEAEADAGTLMSGLEDSVALAAVETDNIGEEAEATTTPAPTATPIPTPTPLPVNGFEEVEGMDALLIEYYNAKAGRDISKMKSLYSDPSKAESEEELERKVKYIEECKNIKTYAKKSYEEGAYIVYAYYDIKFARINTLAPSLSKFYVITDSSGALKIYSEDMSPELKAYYDERNNDEDVLTLISFTDEKGIEAKESDEDLNVFWTGYEKIAQEKLTAQAQGDAAPE